MNLYRGKFLGKFLIIFFTLFIEFFILTSSVNADTCVTVTVGDYKYTACSSTLENNSTSKWIIQQEIKNGSLSSTGACTNGTYIKSVTYICSKTKTHTGRKIIGRGNCIINSNKWTTGGSIKCIQTPTSVPTYTMCGCGTSCSSPGAKPGSVTKTVTLDLTNPISSCNNVYANNQDKCSLTFKTNAISLNGTGKKVTGITGTKIINIEDKSEEPSNRVDGIYNKNSDNALVFPSVSSISLQDYSTGGSTIYGFVINNIMSISPFHTTNGKLKFDLSYNGKVTSNVSVSDIKYNFLKPFSGNIGIEGSDELKVGTTQKLKLNIDVDSSNCNYCTNLNGGGYTIEEFDSSIELEDSINYSLDKDLSTLTDLSGNPEIDVRIDFVGTDLGTTNILADPNISYSFIGEPNKEVKYKLGDNNLNNSVYEDPLNDDGLELESENFIGVRIVGSQQLDGKYQITGQEGNVSDLSKLALRGTVRENGYKLIKGMESNTISNRVKYIDGYVDGDSNGNYDLSGYEGGYDTLVVKNGNVLISGDIDQSVGIIVLKDNYSILNDSSEGNIYIMPNVQYIKAIAYADGGLISVDSTGNVFDDSSTRTQTLLSQLIFEGSLFTRNTVGGAILAGGDYVLPGGEGTTSFDLSMRYDLNYVRRGIEGSNAYNQGYTEDPFVIIYDSNLQTNPPIGFK